MHSPHCRKFYWAVPAKAVAPGGASCAELGGQELGAPLPSGLGLALTGCGGSTPAGSGQSSWTTTRGRSFPRAIVSRSRS